MCQRVRAYRAVDFENDGVGVAPVEIDRSDNSEQDGPPVLGKVFGGLTSGQS
jgi:hypothetical protein